MKTISRLVLGVLVALACSGCVGVVVEADPGTDADDAGAAVDPGIEIACGYCPPRQPCVPCSRPR